MAKNNSKTKIGNQRKKRPRPSAAVVRQDSERRRHRAWWLAAALGAAVSVALAAGAGAAWHAHGRHTASVAPVAKSAAGPKQSTKKMTAQPAGSQPAPAHPATVSTPAPANNRNNQRKNDAAELLGEVGNFYATNIAKFPIQWSAGQLTGGQNTRAVQAPLVFYKSVSFQTDGQPPVADDEVIVVTGAACALDGSTTASQVDKAYAVQFATENSDGSFKSACESY